MTDEKKPAPRTFKDWSLNSKIIESTQYDLQTKALIVKFQTGTKYKYLDVPIDVWERMLNAESVGKFLNSDIKPHYTALKM